MTAEHALGPRHFVDVWNPSYASNAMEAHLAILLGATARFDLGQLASDQEIYVWWGKVRSANRRQALAKLDTILGIGAELEGDQEREGHLYLTDYRALYVGHVVGMTREDVRETDQAHVPDYYAKNHLECDFWYKLMDVRRLVADDTLAVIAELKRLRNVDYNDLPVSLYGGMVDLPLIVTRPDRMRFFEPEVRDEVTDEALWVEFDAQAGGVGAMERELRENLFGDAVWMALEPAARTFIATAEKIFRDHRNDPAFDFGPVVGNFAKALEVSLNAVLARVLPDVPEKARLAGYDGRTVDVLERMPLTLGQFARAVGGEQALNAAITQRLVHGGWFARDLAAVADGVAQVRNPGAHQQRVGRDAAMIVRNQLVGVGCQGALAELTKVRLK
jgi:hypothetical protein